MKLNTFIKQRLMSSDYVRINNLGNKILYDGCVKFIPYYLIDTDIIFATFGGNEPISICIQFSN